MKFKIKKKTIFKILVILFILTFAGVAIVLGINSYIKSSVSDKIITSEKSLKLEDIDCVIVLGCYVDEMTPSNMLKDRLDVGVELYNMGASPKILMSGDHGRTDYDEVNAMKLYAMKKDVPSEDIFMDHAGFSTYESMYRASEIFKAEKVLIVSQEYHLYRAIYIAEQFGMEAYGVPSDLHKYVNQNMYDLREILARNKDFVKSFFKAEPTYLGEAIPINGNGNSTNDKKLL